MTHCEKCGEPLERVKCMSPYGGYEISGSQTNRYWLVMYRCPIFNTNGWQVVVGHTHFMSDERIYKEPLEPSGA